MSKQDSENEGVAKQQQVGYSWRVERTRKIKRDKSSKYADDEKTMVLSGNDEYATVATAQMLSANAAIDQEIANWENPVEPPRRPRNELPLQHGEFSEV